MRWLTLAALSLCCGCMAVSEVKTSSGSVRTVGSERILLVEPDVELGEVTAGGAIEPRADWTLAARRNLEQALRQRLQDTGDELLVYQPPLDEPERLRRYDQLIKLHTAVGRSILVHGYIPRYRLPTKGDRLDWTLGPGVRDLAEGFDAHYALFVTMRDSYTSYGRAAVMALAVVLFGQVPYGGVQQGFASLVDLRTGQVVWFNVLRDDGGDLRDPVETLETVRLLLKDVPL